MSPPPTISATAKANSQAAHIGPVRGAVGGVAAAATVLGVGHLVAAFVAPAASPFFVLGATMIDHTPHELKDAAIRQFGSHDKQALFISMGVVMVFGAVSIGLLERRRPLGSVLLLALGGVTLAAALERPSATIIFALPALAGTATGIVALRVSIIGSLTARGAPRPSGMSRRRFLTTTTSIAVVAAAGAATGRVIAARLRDVSTDRARFVLPRPAHPAPPPPAQPQVPGITPFLTPVESFYRVDTALQLPALTSSQWRLRIHGMVDRTVEFDFDRLRELEPVEKIITMTCVSNEVGGGLAGTARWLGYPLADLIARAGPHPDADLMLSRSIDGFTAGTPLSAIQDGRDALLAVGMNGRPLPIEHGYPARLVVPGLYGYVSATKWVIDLEVTRFDRTRAYWTERGWSDRAPIKTASRIDAPAAFATMPAGPVTVAGVSWAQQRGIAEVQVQVDDAPWQTATLAAEYSPDTWRLWTWQWNATPGTHTLRVRATDRTGQLQTDERADPFPNGATGRHTRQVMIR